MDFKRQMYTLFVKKKKKTNVIQSDLSDHSRVKSETNHRRKTGKVTNVYQADNRGVNGETTKEIKQTWRQMNPETRAQGLPGTRTPKTKS